MFFNFLLQYQIRFKINKQDEELRQETRLRKDKKDLKTNFSSGKELLRQNRKSKVIKEKEFSK